MEAKYHLLYFFFKTLLNFAVNGPLSGHTALLQDSQKLLQK